ncbi:hypothetical protein N7499_012741 [Penicillium canescens]|nr:hypothetical protein N7499_012741 [Penicillium canescens]KAJ6154443.1 hypothetical protein N7485_012812 [Penicillium canescens]
METAFGVVGITSMAIHSINSLIQDINAVKDAPNVIADLKDELIAMEAVLVALDNARKNSQLENLTADVQVALQLANTNCQKSCEKFRLKLRQWSKHSEDGLHWRDRFRVGLFAERSVKALSAQLNCSKSTMNAAVSTAALISSSALSSDTKGRDLRTKEIEISKQIVEIDEQNALVQLAPQNFAEAPLSENEDRSEVMEQLRDQRVTLDESRKLLEDLLAQAHQVRTGEKITKVEISDGGKLIVGRINYEDEGDSCLDIHDIKATNHGKGVVGMIKGLDVNAFLND